jgi:hypothetical protein
MKTIQKLHVEQIGGDLCLVLKTDDSRIRGILGRISPDRLEVLGTAAVNAAKLYGSRGGENFSMPLLD